MRIDAGMRCRPLVVPRLDGVKVKDCAEADDLEGWVKVSTKGPDGEFSVERRTGVVTLEVLGPCDLSDSYWLQTISENKLVKALRRD